MRILDRYILSSIVKIFFGTSVVFCLIYVMVDSINILSEIIDKEVPFSILAKYYGITIPIIFKQISPAACLIATQLTFGQLNNNNEIIAIRSSGQNFWQISKPALCFGIIVSVLIFFVNEQFVPQATLATERIKNRYIKLSSDKGKAKKEVIKNLTFYGLNNRLYYIEQYDPEEEVLQGITVIENDNNQAMRAKIVALKGIWTGIAWKFYRIQINTFEGGNLASPARVKLYDEKLMDIKETPEDFLTQRLDIDSMNIKQLNEYINRFSNSGANKAINDLRVNVHHKFSFPIGNFVVILIGMPFALMVHGRKRSAFASVGLAFLIGFLYYVVESVSIAFGYGGMFPPILAAWAAPFLVTGIALTVIEYNF